MGIDIHAFNFLRMQAIREPLGNTLTIGRQSLSVSRDYISEQLGIELGYGDGYCESLLVNLTATNFASIDYSDYESPTYVGDLNSRIEIDEQFETIVDAGSLEHIFDTAAAFRNLIRFCKLGGRVIHILPVNNLGGHGFWQFSSDLMYSIYSVDNGFSDTEVYYASGLDFNNWYKTPKAKPGKRIEIVSIEPVILLCVTRKVAEIDVINVVQPFYKRAWDESDVSAIENRNVENRTVVIAKRLLKGRGVVRNLFRDAALVFGLAFGRSRFSIKHRRFERVRVKELFEGLPK